MTTMPWQTTVSMIQKRFKLYVADANSDVPVVYENDNTDRVDENELELDAEVWMRVTARPGTTIQASFGATGFYRTPGVVIVQVFQRLKTGKSKALAMADKVKVAFRATSQEGVRFKVPSIEIVGRSQGNWWQVNVVCPFFVDDTD